MSNKTENASISAAADYKPTNAKGSFAGLTDRETQVLGHWLQCFEVPPKVDYKKFHELVGTTNPKSGVNALSIAKKKITDYAKLKAAPAKADEVKANTNKIVPKATATAKTKRKPLPTLQSKATVTESDVGNKADVDEPSSKRPKKGENKSKAVKEVAAEDVNMAGTDDEVSACDSDADVEDNDES